MSKLDWDRETRETRKRKQGFTPTWADPDTVSLAHQRQIQALLEPMHELVRQFEGFSRTQRGQRHSEFRHRLRNCQNLAEQEAGAFADVSARDAVRRLSAMLIQRLDEACSKHRSE